MKPLDSISPASLKNILLATDFSPASEVVLHHALKIARQYKSKLYIAHVICLEVEELIAPERRSTMVQEAHQFAQQNMERWLSAAGQAGVSCQPLIGEGVIWDVLQDMIRQNSIDLIVVGTHGRRGLRKLLLGSVAEKVFRLAPCPVLTVGPKTSLMRSGDVEMSHILYPLESVPDPSDAAAYAISLADQFHTRLTFMKVFEDMALTSEVSAAIEEPGRHWMDDHVPIGSDLRKRTCFEPGFGPVPEAILRFAGGHGVDLIVMGVRRLDPVMAAHLPKPDTTYEVVRSAHCPVLTVR